MPEMAQKQHHAHAAGTTSHVTALVEQAKAGSGSAFEQLVDMFQKDIFRMAYYRTRAAMDAEDLTQEIFVRVFKHLSKLTAPDRFRSWLFKIALNCIRDFNRKKRFRALFSPLDDRDQATQLYSEASDCPEGLGKLLAEDFWKQVGLFLEKLSRAEREVFVLRFMDHLTIKEISHVLGKSESTIKTHLYRSIQKFKRERSMRELLQEGAA